MKGDGPLTADWLQNWSKLLIHESHSILKCEMFWWEITRWLWYYKYSACYILADLLPHIVMTLFQPKLLSYILSCFFFPFSFPFFYQLSLIFFFFFFIHLPLLINLHRNNQQLMFTDSPNQVSGLPWGSRSPLSVRLSVCVCVCVCVCVWGR